MKANSFVGKKIKCERLKRKDRLHQFRREKKGEKSVAWQRWLTVISIRIVMMVILIMSAHSDQVWSIVGTVPVS